MPRRQRKEQTLPSRQVTSRSILKTWGCLLKRLKPRSQEILERRSKVLPKRVPSGDASRLMVRSLSIVRSHFPTERSTWERIIRQHHEPYRRQPDISGTFRVASGNALS